MEIAIISLRLGFKAFFWFTESMSGGESDSNYRSRNADSATTEAYSDPEAPFEEVMNSSADNDDFDDIEDHFLHNFQCVACHAIPIFEQASQIAAAWAAGELPGVVAWKLERNQENSNSRVMVFCGSCRRFWHATCFFACQFQHQYFRHVAELIIQLAEGYPVVSQFECQKCHNDI